MGYGFPAAIGAKVGSPKRTVFDIAGDGSILMNIQELATAVTYNIPVKIAVLNNSCLGMVRQWQELFYKKRYSATILKNPDLVSIAESFGAKGILVKKHNEVKPAIKKALKKGGLILSLSRIKEILKDNKYPDEELLKIRDELYTMGEITIELFKESKQKKESEVLSERR